MAKTISVIVPVYNVEAYLDRCINSILHQTFYEFELILVDDGSTDNSGVMCDELAKKDSRIIVLHKVNGGLSDARNKGIEVASGEYITFIDSDDWISKDYLSKLYDNLLKYDADISCCNFHKTKCYIEKAVVKNRKIFTLIAEDKYRYFLENETVSATAKLFKKNIFENIEFPKGKLYEDVATIFSVFIKSKKIVFDNAEMYFYFQNSNSITKRKFSIKTLDFLDAWQSVNDQISRLKISSELKKLAKLRYAKVFFTLAAIIAFYGIEGNNEQIQRSQKYILENLRKNYLELLKWHGFKFSRKIVLCFMMVSFDLCLICGKIYRLK